MYLRYYLNEKSERVYTFSVCQVLILHLLSSLNFSREYFSNLFFSSTILTTTLPSAHIPLDSLPMIPSLSRESSARRDSTSSPFRSLPSNSENDDLKNNVNHKRKR